MCLLGFALCCICLVLFVWNRQPPSSSLTDTLFPYHDALPSSLDFRRAHAVAGNVDDVVDPAGDPVIAVGIAATAVAGEILAGEGRKIRVDEALVEIGRAHV